MTDSLAVMQKRRRCLTFFGGGKLTTTETVSQVIDYGRHADGLYDSAYWLRRKPSKNAIRGKFEAGEDVFEWPFEDGHCQSLNMMRLPMVGRLEGHQHALRVRRWAVLPLIKPMDLLDIQDALNGRIKGKFVTSAYGHIRHYGQEILRAQSVSFEREDDIVFGKMALFG